MGARPVWSRRPELGEARMDRGGLAERPVKLAEAASLSDDPWYSQRLDALTSDLAARTREVLGIERDATDWFEHALALIARMRRDNWRSGLA